MTTTKGQRAYELRQTTGKPWDEVAEVVGCKSGDAAVAGAKKYAKRSGLEWPMKTIKDRRAKEAAQAKEVAQAKADAGVYRKVRDGTPVSRIKGLTPTLVYKAVERHAERSGDAPLAKNPERAYQMRQDEGRTWREIATTLGYKRDNNAIEQARIFAEANDLPWPIAVEQYTRPGWDAGRYVGKPFYDDAAGGLPWTDVADKHGRYVSYVMSRAEVYAKANNQQWPV
jgi:hypothetical protein